MLAIRGFELFRLSFVIFFTSFPIFSNNVKQSNSLFLSAKNMPKWSRLAHLILTQQAKSLLDAHFLQVSFHNASSVQCSLTSLLICQPDDGWAKTSGGSPFLLCCVHLPLVRFLMGGQQLASRCKGLEVVGYNPDKHNRECPVLVNHLGSRANNRRTTLLTQYDTVTWRQVEHTRCVSVF